MSLAGLSCVYARRGRVDSCRETTALASELSDRNHIRLGTFWVLFARGDVAAGLGDPGSAVVQYEALEELLASTGFAAAYLDVIAVTSGYNWVAPAVGLALAGAVAAAGVVTAMRWRSVALAVIVNLACALTAPALTDGLTLTLD